MYDVNKLAVHWQDKNSIYHLPKEDFKKNMVRRFYESQQGKRIVCLDLNFWINFRDGTPLYTALQEKLRTLVEKQQIICVVSSSILDEMGKMPTEKRLATAKIMDSLHCNAVLNNISICTHEWINLDLAILGGELMKSYFLSPVFEANPFLSEFVLNKHQSESDFIFNVFYEDLFSMSVEEYFKQTDSRHYDSSDQFARGFNQAKLNRTNPQNYTDVLEKGLLSQMKTCADLIPYNFKSTIDVTRSLALFIKHAPYMFIVSAVNAAIAVDRDRVFKANDFFDTQHSCAAIGYADFFFTERKFYHLLQSKPINISDHFKIKVGSEPTEIMNQLQDL